MDAEGLQRGLRTVLEDAPERMKDTLALWKQSGAGKKDIYLSQVTLEEVGECREQKIKEQFEYSGILYLKTDNLRTIVYNDFYNFLKGNHDYGRNGTYTDWMYAGGSGSESPIQPKTQVS